MRHLFTLHHPPDTLNRLRNWLARLFHMGGRGDAHPEWIARTVLSALIAAAIWLPLFLLVEAFTRFPGLVSTLIAFFRGFAELIGAIPPGVIA